MKVFGIGIGILFVILSLIVLVVAISEFFYEKDKKKRSFTDCLSWGIDALFEWRIIIILIVIILLEPAIYVNLNAFTLSDIEQQRTITLSPMSIYDGKYAYNENKGNSNVNKRRFGKTS